MSVLISKATGNWLTAGTWALVDSTSFLRSESGSTVVPTSAGAGARSAGSTTGAITIDAIAVSIATRNGSTGTITARLWNNTDSVLVAGATCTLNVSDLPNVSSGTLDGAWAVFAFGTNVTLLAAKSYMVEVISSSASQVSLWTNGTANNWSRALRTTTTQAPVAGDDVIVAGEHTGAGTGNDFTVTMNETAATDYGSNTTSTVTPALAICKRGTLTFNSASAANPKLRLSGHLIAYNGGTLNIGTTGTPIPRDSVAVLEFDPAADGDFGLIARNGSTVSMQGLSRTSGKNVVSCKLTADASASAAAPSTSTISVNTDTGWLSGDQVAVASTTRTSSDCETGTLNADAGASSMVLKNMAVAALNMAVGAALTSNRGLLAAHSGTSPTQAEVILLTRNVRCRSVSTTAMTFFQFNAGANVDIDWTEFYYVGTQSAGKRAIDLRAQAGGAINFSMQYSSVHTTESEPFYSDYTTQAVTALVCSNNCFWNLFGAFTLVSAMTTPSWVVDNNVLIRSISGFNGFSLADVGGTFTNNTVVGASFGITFPSAGVCGTFSNNTTHSNASRGVNIGVEITGDLGTLTIWRNNDTGITISAPTFDLSCSPTMFGNSTDNILLSASCGITLNSPVLNGDTTFSTSNGIRVSSGSYNIRINNGDFSTASGIKTAHSNIDISLTGTLVEAQMVLHNTKLGAATQFGGTSVLSRSGFISCEKFGQVAGTHKTIMKYGVTSRDATIYDTAAPSARMTPNNASAKLEIAPKGKGFLKPVDSGGTVSISAKTRKSVSGDGAAYNGNQPRLIQRANTALGQDSDVVLDTHTVAAGSWETLSATSSTATDDGAFEFIVDCDGTTGWVNVEDFA